MQGQLRLLLARHGQTEWHHDNRYVSRTNIELNDAGRREAQALAQRAQEERPALVLCSPLNRALETARMAATASGAELRVDDRLREVDFGRWEGRTLEEMRELYPEAVRQFETDPGDAPFPGGEPLPTAVRRILDIHRDLLKSHRGQAVLVVAHNTLLRLSLCVLLGIPLRLYRRRLPRLLNAAISEVRLSGPEDGALYSLNDSKHLQC